jgi:hypothetical protein
MQSKIIWDEQAIKKFEYEIQWLKDRISSGVSKGQRKEYEYQIRKKELEIAFNGSQNK